MAPGGSRVPSAGLCGGGRAESGAAGGKSAAGRGEAVAAKWGGVQRRARGGGAAFAARSRGERGRSIAAVDPPVPVTRTREREFS